MEQLIQLYHSGKLTDANKRAEEMLQENLNSFQLFNITGAIQLALGQLDKSATNFQQAIKLKPDYADAHNNLGFVLADLGKPDEALACYEQAIKLKPDFAEAYNNLGTVLKNLGKLEDAENSYRKALSFNPDYAKAHCNLGTVLKDLDNLEDAVTSYQKALDLEPDYAMAYNNLGNALQALGKLEKAIASYHKAISLKPDYAEAHYNIGIVLSEIGKSTVALAHHRRAISLDPQNDLFWAYFSVSLENASFTSIDNRLYQDLLNLLERPTVRPSYVCLPIISALRHHPEFSAILEIVVSSQEDREFVYSDIAAQLSTIPLFLRILELSPISDLEIERMLTVLRRHMLKETIKRKTKGKIFQFSTALAHNCFINEYIFTETEAEKEAIENLEQQITILMEKGLSIPPSFVVTLGAYRPLFQFSWAKELGELNWEDDINYVIKRQITEPLKERSLLDQIPCITPIQNIISQSVRAQYEENPYPRWVKTETYYRAKRLGTVLKGPPLRFDLGDYVSPESPEILVAGCGTGQHALGTASAYLNSRVLAVDLCLKSLAYAQRKTRELGFSNIEYVHGDIMELGKIERQFDLIECIGVLHHLGDPLAGWQILANLLRPGGLMKIGLYSEMARQHIIAGRSLIAKKGYAASADDIRRCRQTIVAMAGDGDDKMAKICNKLDFFSLSNCRDLLFHVQEHRFTLPQIEEALSSLHLKFLGFEMRNQRTLRKFRETHTSSKALTSLSLWHEFELKNPNYLLGYSFWCQKL